SLYEQEHARILHIVDCLIERVGMENAKEALKLFQLIAQIAREEIR
ncbi:MAG: MarR family transcriptional regulator, partial [Amedibacillus dolichus]